MGDPVPTTLRRRHRAVKIKRLVRVHDFAANWRTPVTERWHTAGPRTSPIDKEMRRQAASPVHAMLNYGYAILESEAILACHARALIRPSD